VKKEAQYSKRPTKLAIQDNVWELIQRCILPDAEVPLSMDEIVEEMESWKEHV
jgi:hypothetical protein